MLWWDFQSLPPQPHISVLGVSRISVRLTLDTLEISFLLRHFIFCLFLKKHFTWMDLESLDFILCFQLTLLVSTNKRKMMYSVLRWMLVIAEDFFSFLKAVLKHLLTPPSAL